VSGRAEHPRGEIKICSILIFIPLIVWLGVESRGYGKWKREHKKGAIFLEPFPHIRCEKMNFNKPSPQSTNS